MVDQLELSSEQEWKIVDKWFDDQSRAHIRKFIGTMHYDPSIDAMVLEIIPVAQSQEPSAHNAGVAGSSPAGDTIAIGALWARERWG